mgnify:CR=1 FL=1
MNLAVRPLRVIESVDRRILGAFQLVDAVTGIPIDVPAAVEAQHMVVAGQPGDVRLPQRAVRILRNRGGRYVVLAAPFFDTYAATFDNPPVPEQAAAGPLGLRIAVTDPGNHHLPRDFRLNLPRSLDPSRPDSVFEPLPVPLFRAPGAPAQDGWAVLRVRVTRAGTNPPVPLPGVLIAVFRRPRGGDDEPLGLGMTEWRGAVRGEALVALSGLTRFRPGAGNNVVERDHPISFEATRDNAFDGAAGRMPGIDRLVAGTGAGVVRVSDRPPDPLLQIVQPAELPVRVEAGREHVIHLAMP